MNAYLDDSGRALKPQPADDESTGQGPLMGCDPRPLALTGGGVVLVGFQSACASLRLPVRGTPTRAAGGVFTHCGSCTGASPDDVWV